MVRYKASAESRLRGAGVLAMVTPFRLAGIIRTCMKTAKGMPNRELPLLATAAVKAVVFNSRDRRQEFD